MKEDKRGALTRAPLKASVRRLCLRRVSGANTNFRHPLPFAQGPSRRLGCGFLSSAGPSSQSTPTPVAPSTHPPRRGFRDSRATRKLWRTGELLALARSRGARPPRPCSAAPSPMSLLPTPTRRARRPARHARARVVPETVRSTNLAAPVIPTRRLSAILQGADSPAICRIWSRSSRLSAESRTASVRCPAPSSGTSQPRGSGSPSPGAASTSATIPSP